MGISDMRLKEPSLSERSRLEQRISRVEVMFHLLPKARIARNRGVVHTTPESVLRHLFVRVRTPQRRLRGVDTASLPPWRDVNKNYVPSKRVVH